MREFIKNEKVLALVRKAMENKCITYEEINDGLKDDFPVDKIEQLITGMMDQGIEIIRQADIDKNKKIAKEFIPLVVDRLKEKNVEVRGDETACEADSRIVPATQQDWGTEYLDYIISLKTVDTIDEAIEHINKYNTGHSESIITNDYNHALKFQDEIDAAAVYVNASTRFTDGFEFGFGAEIGISTQKLHARGPMGLEALTTTKYIIFGNGQIRK